MDKATLIFNKLAFITVTPFKVKDKEELKSVRGYAKEIGNAAVSSLAGGLTGALAGGLLGTIGGIVTKDPKMALIGLGIATGIGGGAGGFVSSIRGVRKTEQEAGVKPMSSGKFLGRLAGGLLASPVPIVGSLAGDYFVSRHLQEYKK